MGIERRRNARIQASLAVEVVGLEAAPSPRRGDVSVTGAFLELDVDPGEPGSMRRLRLATRDAAARIEVDARVIRVVRTDDLFRGASVSGAAFEFIARSRELREAIEEFVAYVAGVDAAGLEARGAASVAGASVETKWPLRAGERIEVVVPSAHGASVRVVGRATRSRKVAGGVYRTRVEVEGEAPLDVADRSVSGLHAAIEAAAADQRQRASAREHLAGDLGRIKVPSLLSLVALERMTGSLRLRAGDDEARLYVREGQIVDVVGDAPSPRVLLARLCRWEAGRFELTLEPVTRPDALGISTTALLLDLAREQDEERLVA